MLQQTQAARVAPAFERFLSAFPSVRSLAAASRGDVVRSWDGLGYNRRAIALSDAARTIVRDHDGLVPSDPQLLRALPGIGPYTADAVASISFGVPVPALDTNVRRVVARVRLGLEPHEAPGARVRTAAEEWLDRDDPGPWNEALMDLGREVCRPRPRCDVCPLSAGCRFLATDGIPRAAPRRQQPFEGSSRQVRGAVVRHLRRTTSATLRSIATLTGFDRERVRHAVGELHREGLVVAGPAAIDGRTAGRVRLPS